MMVWVLFIAVCLAEAIRETIIYNARRDRQEEDQP